MDFCRPTGEGGSRRRRRGSHGRWRPGWGGGFGAVRAGREGRWSSRTGFCPPTGAL